MLYFTKIILKHGVENDVHDSADKHGVVNDERHCNFLPKMEVPN